MDQVAALTVIHIINRILTSSSEQPHHQTKACYTICAYRALVLSSVILNAYFIVDSLVRDEKDLGIKAVERGILASLVSLIKSITPLDNTDC